ncbi:hypothetical protein [Beijerinckia indica]|nr:hypothetical protein [Beijerinckia indica]
MPDLEKPLHPSQDKTNTIRKDENAEHRERRLELLIDRLPPRLRQVIRGLRQPGRPWRRRTAGVLFICGGFLAILPILGLWMLPLGLLLLAEDIPLLARGCDRALDWIERYRPHWLNDKKP